MPTHMKQRRTFFRLHEHLIAKYKPYDPAEAIVVKKIALAEWRSLNFDELFTTFSNKEPSKNTTASHTAFPSSKTSMSNSPSSSDSPIPQPSTFSTNQSTKELNRSIATFEKQIQFEATFPDPEKEPDSFQLVAQ